MHSPFTARFLAIALCSTLLYGAAAAADKPKPPSQRILTPEQLRACNAQRDLFAAQNDEANKTKAELESERAEIEKTRLALKEDGAALDRTNKEAVDAFNLEASALDQTIDAHQARVGAFNAKVQTVKESHDAYVKSCDKRRYDERDLPEANKSKP